MRGIAAPGRGDGAADGRAGRPARSVDPVRPRQSFNVGRRATFQLDRAMILQRKAALFSGRQLRLTWIKPG
ncbi:hypothetical protein [Methylobacterium sp. A54F]